MYKDLVKIKKDEVYIGKVNLKKLVDKYSTPLIVYDQNLIIEKVKVILDNFKSDKFKCNVLYASKAFSIKAIYQLLKPFDIGADVVSLGELTTAVSAGFDTQKIFFHGNNKAIYELEAALNHNIGCIVIDNFNEIEYLSTLTKKLNKKVKVLIRINPGISAHTHSYIQTAKYDSKFGVSIYDDAIYQMINQILQCEGLEFMGLHFHIGSQIFEDNVHIKACKIVIELIKKLNDKNIKIKWLNIGGGFGVSINSKDEPYDLGVMLAKLVKKVESFLKINQVEIEELFIEPGRFLVSEAALTLYTIGGMKSTFAKKDYLFIDGGMSDNIRPALYQAKYECDILNKINFEKTHKVSIAGKNCESSDILIKDTLLPKADLSDLLMVYSTGAYTYSMASNYNRLPRPAIVFIKDSKAQLVVKRETYQDIMKNDLNLKD